MTDANMSLVPIAQDQAWRKLVAMSSALPQGLILIGPPGVGKRRSIKALFQLLNCAQAGGGPRESAEASLFGAAAPVPARETSLDAEPCGRCASCRKIAEGKHADLIEIAPRGDSIAVDDLRELKKSLHFAPFESRYRFVILDQAHRLNTASGNTLLKTLEEPPEHTRFFLITHERALLLPTIVSRCQFVHFSALDDSTLTALLERNGLSIPDDLKRTSLALLGGGMDRAALLTDEKTLEFLAEAHKQLASRDRSWDAATRFADQLTTAQSDAGDWKTELLLDLIAALAHRDALMSRTPDEARRFATRALDATYLRGRLGRHANKKLVALAAADLALAGAER